MESIIPEPTPSNPLAVWGQALHYVFQLFYTPHPSTGNYPYAKLEALLAIWGRVWLGAVNKEHPYNSLREFRSPYNQALKNPMQPEEVAWEYEGQHWTLYQEGIKVLTAFHAQNEERRRNGTIRLLEQSFTIRRWHGLELHGVIDRIDIRAEKEKAQLVDYKNGRLVVPELESGIQLTIYQLAFFHLRANGQIPGQPSLVAMFAYNYRRQEYQRARLRGPDDVGQLFWTLLQLRVYWDGVLFGREYPPEFTRDMTNLKLRDMKSGDASPLLPRGDHCRYCRVFQQCREWELGKRPRAREAYAEHYQLRQAKRMELQRVIPIASHPLVVNEADRYRRLAELVRPVPMTMEELMAPILAPAKARSRQKAS